MLEDGSGKIGIVEGVMVRFDEREVAVGGYRLLRDIAARAKIRE